MTANPKDLHDILTKMRYETTVLQGQITNALQTLAALNLPQPDQPQHQCPHDGLEFPTQVRLDEHIWNVHGIYKNDDGTTTTMTPPTVPPPHTRP